MAITKIINTIIRPSNPKNWLYKDVVLESKMPNHFTKRIFAKEVINESESNWMECTQQEKDSYFRT